MRAEIHHAGLRDRFQVFPRPDDGVTMFHNHMFDDGGATAIAHAAAGAARGQQGPLREASGRVPRHHEEKWQMPVRSAAADRNDGDPGESCVEPHSGRGVQDGRLASPNGRILPSQLNPPGATS